MILIIGKRLIQNMKKPRNQHTVYDDENDSKRNPQKVMNKSLFLTIEWASHILTPLLNPKK